MSPPVKWIDAKHLDSCHCPCRYEADAQLAYMCRQGWITTAISEDSDLLAYGCPSTFFKMDKYGNGEHIALPCLQVDHAGSEADKLDAPLVPKVKKPEKGKRGKKQSIPCLAKKDNFCMCMFSFVPSKPAFRTMTWGFKRVRVVLFCSYQGRQRKKVKKELLTRKVNPKQEQQKERTKGMRCRYSPISTVGLQRSLQSFVFFAEPTTRSLTRTSRSLVSKQLLH